MPTSQCCVIRPAASTAPPALPCAVLKADRAGRRSVFVGVQIGIGEAACRRVLSRPLRQFDPERRIEGSDVAAVGQRLLRSTPRQPPDRPERDSWLTIRVLYV